MEDPEIRYLGDLARLDVKPGDRFVMKLARQASEQEAQHLRQAWRKATGDDVRLILLGPGIELGVIGASDAD